MNLFDPKLERIQYLNRVTVKSTPKKEETAAAQPITFVLKEMLFDNYGDRN